MTGRKLYENATERPCSRCKIVKPMSEFHRNRTNHTGRSCHCKQCHNSKYYDFNERRAIRLKKDYGITPEQYDKMRQDQDDKCAICHKPENHGQLLAVDHCHKTGRVRGLLCFRCNSTIGAAESIGMDKIARYLERLA